jgi:AmmeMemoRadiSam system protein B
MNHFANQEVTVQKDTKALAPLLELSPEKLFNTVREERISMCGVCPATMALFASNALGAREAKLVAYGTSAAASGDTGRVVGYAGAYVC